MQINQLADDDYEEDEVELPWANLRLPPFPQVALRVLQLADRDGVPVRELSDLICSDPGFSSEILAVANCVLYATRTPVTSVLRAISVIGTNRLRGICITVGIRAYLGGSRKNSSLQGVWRHSLACAFIAERLAIAGMTDKDSAYTAGIMHDIGRLALAAMHPTAYTALLATHIGSPRSFLDRERELFGLDHTQAGRHIIVDWELPPDLQPIVAHHHAHRWKGDGWRLSDLINVSCRMADAVGFSAFAGGTSLPYADLVKELPLREAGLFPADVETLTWEIAGKINAIESI